MAEQGHSTKTCSKCSLEKPSDQFTKRPRGRPVCKECTRVYQLAWQRANPDKVAAKKKRYRERHPDRANLKSARRREIDRQQRLARRAANPEAARERSRRNAHRAYHKDVERTRAKRREWYAKNRDYVISLKNAYEARLRGDRSGHRDDAVAEILRMQKGRCAYCRKLLSKYEVDHIQPTSKGGSNDRRNIQITCKSCNVKKHAKDPIEFARSLGLLL